MSTHNIPFFNVKKENHLKLPHICSYGTFSKGLKDESEPVVVTGPSVFEPLKFYCSFFSGGGGGGVAEGMILGHHIVDCTIT